MKRLREKLKSISGESISEVLIAMLIIELALLMAVSMIMSAGKQMKKSERSFKSYYARKNALETGAEETDTINGVQETFSRENGSAAVAVTVASTTGAEGAAGTASPDISVYKVKDGDNTVLVTYEQKVSSAPATTEPEAGSGGGGEGDGTGGDGTGGGTEPSEENPGGDGDE